MPPFKQEIQISTAAPIGRRNLSTWGRNVEQLRGLAARSPDAQPQWRQNSCTRGLVNAATIQPPADAGRVAHCHCKERLVHGGGEC